MKNKFILEISGKVVSGLGEGKIFLMQSYYLNAFKEKLGFGPYPGTLNVVIDDILSMQNRVELDMLRGIEIPEYREKERVLGSVKAFFAKINDEIDGAVVIPARTIHPKSVIEIISPYYLREKLSLKDGVRVKITVFA
ncbi:hypothetical protein HS7_19280 [Sulfolobales archaeon HS-7]|nr:hypothetical protein HS7_19280 [Sulfolobales archaeon HS-7]